MYLVVFVMCLAALEVNAGSLQTLSRIIRKVDDDTQEKELKQTSNAIDAEIQQEHSEFSPIQEGYYFQPIYFHADDCTVSLSDIKMLQNGIQAQTNTSLIRRTIFVKVSPETILVEGKFKLHRLSFNDVYSKASGTFRLTTTGLKCEGTAAIEAGSSISVEWLHLFCDHKGSNVTTQKYIDFSRGTFIERYIDEKFDSDVNDNLEREVSDALESLTTSWLTKRLEGMSMIVRQNAKLQSQAYNNSTSEEEADGNELFDLILAFAVAFIKDHYNDTIKIPDIKEGFEKNVLNLVKVGAQFYATDGTAREVSTLERDGNSRIHRKNETIFFIGGIKFQRLHVVYRRYKADVIGIGPSGSLATVVTPVAVHIVLRADVGGTRKIFLDRFRITDAGKIKVRITAIGRIFDRILSIIATWVVAVFKTQVLSLVQKRVLDYARSALNKTTIDDIIAGRFPLS